MVITRHSILCISIISAMSGILSSCNTAPDLVLNDPASFERMISGALEGEVFIITKEDYPEIEKLLAESNPGLHRAGIILAGQTGDAVFFLDVFLASMSEDEEIAETAAGVILDNSQVFRSSLLQMLDHPNSSHRENAISIIAQTGGEDIVPLLIRFFGDSDENIRNQASLAVWRIADKTNPFLQEALNSPDTLVASIAYRTLGRYTDPDYASFFIEAFKLSDSRIRKEAQLAVLRLGEAGLPYLHDEVNDRNNPLNSRLIALNVLQGLRLPGSLLVLFGLLSDENEGIRTKVASLLGTYGDDAVPMLIEIYETAEIPLRIQAITQMGVIGASSALPTLIDALGSSIPEIGQTAHEAIEFFGTEAWPRLREVIKSDESISRISAMQILRSGRDIWLVRNESGEINNAGLFLLITLSDQSEIDDYLNAVEISHVLGDSILSLKNAWNLAVEFVEIDTGITQGSEPYFYLWRQRLKYAVEARKTLRQSFVVLHEYFDTPDPNILNESKTARKESRQLKSRVEALTERIDELPQSMKISGENQLAEYKSIRDELVQIWKYCPGEMKEVALSIYADRGLNPIDLSQEAAILD